MQTAKASWKTEKIYIRVTAESFISRNGEPLSNLYINRWLSFSSAHMFFHNF